MTSEQRADDSENSADAPKQASPPTSDLQTSDLIEGYHVIAEWIRFADAKAAVVLTVGGAIAGLVIPTLKNYLAESSAAHPTEWWTAMVIGLYSVWLLLLMASGIWSFRCILPFRQKGRHPALGKCAHFHPAAIGSEYGLDEADRFTGNCEQMGDAGLRKEVAACLLIDSHISGAKYRRVTTSIRLMGVSAFVAVFYLIAIQF